MKITRNNLSIMFALFIGIISTNTYSRISTVRINNARNQSMGCSINYYTYSFDFPGVLYGQTWDRISHSREEEIPANSTKNINISPSFELYSVKIWSQRGLGSYLPAHHVVNLSGDEQRVADIGDKEPYMLEITIRERPHYSVGGFGLGSTSEIEHEITYLGNKP